MTKNCRYLKGQIVSTYRFYTVSDTTVEMKRKISFSYFLRLALTLPSPNNGLGYVNRFAHTIRFV